MILAAMLVGQVATPVQASADLPNEWLSQMLAMAAPVRGLDCVGARAYVYNQHGGVAVWDGASWSKLPMPPEDTYVDEMAVSPDGHVFFNYEETIREWNGSAWASHKLTEWSYEIDRGSSGGQMVAASAEEVYVVGRGRIARGGSRGFQVYSPATWRSLSAVALVGADLWVGGQGGTVMRLRGSSWQRVATPSDRWIHRFYVLGPTDVWAVADGLYREGGNVMHWDGKAWELRDAGLYEDRPVFGIGGAGDVVYAASRYGLLRWSGGAWTPELELLVLGAPYEGLRDVCATDRHFVTVDQSGHALMRAR